MSRFLTSLGQRNVFAQAAKTVDPAVSIHLELKRIGSIVERSEHVGDIRVVHGFAGIIRNQILLGHIGDIIALIVFSEQVVIGLFADRAAVFGDGLIPLFRVGKLRINVKNHAAERVFFMAYDLPQAIFCARSDHFKQPLSFNI